MKSQKKIGIIGCGMRSVQVFECLHGLGKEIKINTLYDPNPLVVEAFKNRIAPNANICNDYRDITSDKSVDWVFVMSPNNFHKNQILAAISTEKNIFSEKPLAISPQECLTIKQAYKKNSVKFVMGFTLRYSPHYRKIKQLIDNGFVGNILSMEFNETLDFNHGGYIHSDWRRYAYTSGGHLLEKCCHDIDMANQIVQSDVALVASFGGKNFFLPKNERYIGKLGKNEQGRDAYCTFWTEHDNNWVNPFTGGGDVVDNQVAIIEYENGVRATFHTNCNAGIPERRMYILGTEGAIRADVIAGVIEVKRIGFNEPIHNESASVSGDHGGGDDLLGIELYDCIVNNTEPISTLEDGYNSAMVSFAIDKARETATVVDVKEFVNQIELKG